METRCKIRILLLLGLLLCAFPLPATKDRPCHSGDFQLTAEPTKRSFTNGEPATFRLTFTNLTSRDVYIVPYLFPFDYWVDKHIQGRWKSGFVGPDARTRRLSPLLATQLSERRRIRPRESFTTNFEPELSSITKSVSGTFRLNTVRAYVYDGDSRGKNLGCALFTAKSVPFTVQ
jgi:hypothetical protein